MKFRIIDKEFVVEPTAREIPVLSSLLAVGGDATDQEIDAYLSRTSSVFGSFGLRGECLQDMMWQEQAREALDDHLLSQNILMERKMLSKKCSTD